MDTSIRYIITRTLSVLAVLIALLYGYGLYNKHKRKSACIEELKIICGESSYFRQFSADDAHKNLVKAIGLLAQAESLGMGPDEAIKSALGMKREWFAEDQAEADIPPAKKLIGTSLRANFENFSKLGFKSDGNTIKMMIDGVLPALPSGALAGRKPIIKTIIPAQASPGIEKVIANLELAPPDSADRPLTDIQVAAAKQLARDLSNARIIEQPVRDKIIEYLTPKEL